MREIIDHKIDGDGTTLRIHVKDEPGHGGASHLYEISGFDTGTNASLPSDGIQPKRSTTILFQNGPIQDHGANGFTNEALLAIVLDRLNSFQSGKYPCFENERCASLIEEALNFLHARTQNRIARGVEGTHKV